MAEKQGWDCYWNLRCRFILKKGYCQFVQTFLETIISHNEINDTTIEEIKELENLYDIERRKSRQKSIGDEEIMLRNAFKFLGFTRNTETEDIEPDKEVVKKPPIDGDEQPQLKSDPSHFKGENEEDPIIDDE